MSHPLPDEYDVLVSVTLRGVAVQIVDRSNNEIIHEQNDLDDVREAIDYVRRTIETSPKFDHGRH